MVDSKNKLVENKTTDSEFVEVWEDLVTIKDLVISLIICSVVTMVSYFIAPNEPPKPLFFGLAGAIIGFIICSILFKPKRNLVGIKDGK